MPFPPRCPATITIKGHKIQCSKHADHTNDPADYIRSIHMFIGHVVWYDDDISNKKRFCGFTHNSPYVYGPGDELDGSEAK